MKPSRLGVGTFKISDKNLYSPSAIQDFIKYSLESGVNLFDTSDSYGNGYIEKQLGSMIKNKIINRKKILISTKFGQGIGYDLESVKKSLERSLRRLNSDYIDYYFFHSGTNEQFDNKKLWSYLNRQKEQGLIRKLGLSLKNDYLIKNDLFQVSKSQDYGIETISFVYNINFRRLDNVLNYFDNFEIFTRVPLSKGDLTKYNKVKKKSILKNLYQHMENIPSIKSLLWVLNNKKISSTLVGFSNFEQLYLNLLAYRLYHEKNS